MQQANIRLDTDTKSRLDAYAKANGTTVTALIRDVVAEIAAEATAAVDSPVVDTQVLFKVDPEQWATAGKVAGRGGRSVLIRKRLMERLQAAEETR